jgi:nitrile hydratase accessory protein
MTGPAALPRDNGTLEFQAPWEGRALALAIALVERLGIPWDDFRQRLIASIAEHPERPYYESWAAALERLVLDHQLTSRAALQAATPSERPAL